MTRFLAVILFIFSVLFGLHGLSIIGETDTTILQQLGGFLVLIIAAINGVGCFIMEGFTLVLNKMDKR